MAKGTPRQPVTRATNQDKHKAIAVAYGEEDTAINTGLI